MSETPIADAVAAMLSAAVPVETVLAFIRTAESALREEAKNGLIALRKADKRRKWDRDRKRGKSTGGRSDIESSSSNDSQGLKVKKESKVPRSTGNPPEAPQPNDGWPSDYETQFWTNFPKERRYDKPQVFKLLAKLRREKVVTWEVLFNAVLQYAASNPGEYAKAPLPWLRGHRWEAVGGGSNGKTNRQGDRGPVDHLAAATARRFGGGGRNGPASGPAGSASPAAGMGHERPGAEGGAEPAFDLDLRPEPGGHVRR